MLSPQDRAEWNRCPKCGSLNIDAGDSYFEFDMVYQNIFCADCYTTWDEVYEGSHRENVQTLAEREAELA